MLRHLMNSVADSASTLDGERMTFRQLAERYREHRVFPAEYAGDRKVAGLRDHRTTARRLQDLLHWFGDHKIQKITAAVIEQFKRDRLATPVRFGKDGRHERPRSITTVNRELQLLRAVLYFAEREGWITRNPFNRTKGVISAADETKRTRILSRDEELLLLAACEGRRAHLRPLVIAALDTAMRRGELIALVWDDIDFGRRLIRVRATTTKTLTERLVPITARLEAELRAMLASPLAGSSVFGYTDAKKGFAATCRQAGILGLRFHDLRATAITRMLQAGVPAQIVMRISGHTQPTTFLRYTRAGAEEIQDVAARLDALVENDPAPALIN